MDTHRRPEMQIPGAAGSGPEVSSGGQDLPEFKSPPVIEVVCGVQFEPLPGFLSVHFGEFWARIRDRYPRTEDRPPLGELRETDQGTTVNAELVADMPPWLHRSHVPNSPPAMGAIEMSLYSTSASTRGEIGDGTAVAFPSAATTLLRESREAPRGSAPGGWPPRSTGLKTMLVATMLPFASVDDVLFRRRWDADTVGGYVLYIGEHAEEWLESPWIIAVWPQRHTYRFASRRPSRRVPARRPFISSASVDEQECPRTPGTMRSLLTNP